MPIDPVLNDVIEWVVSRPIPVAVTGLAGVFFALSYHEHRKQKRRSNSSPKTTIAHQHDLRSLNQSGWLIAKSGKDLAQHLGLTPKIKLILSQSCLDQQTSDWLAQTLYRYVEFVQLLPASEAHHHANPGGLAKHTIEVALLSLRRRRGQILPKGATQEERAPEQHRWTVAILLCALFHDAGKVVTDVRVQGLTHDGREIEWSPMGGSMKAIGIDRYRVFFKEHQYSDHKSLGAFLLSLLCPKEMLAWLGSNQGLMHGMNAYLSDEQSGDLNYQSIRDIVSKADQSSVKLDLGYGAQPQFASARTRPLIDVMMTSMNQLLSKGLIKINQPGAVGFVKEGEIFLVSKVIADAVREYIQTHHQAFEVSLPHDNERLFSIWQDYGQLIPNSSGKAMWHINIDDGDKFKTKLSVLRFPLEVVFGANISLWPSDFIGSISVVDVQQSVSVVESKAQAQNNTKIQPVKSSAMGERGQVVGEENETQSPETEEEEVPPITSVAQVAQTKKTTLPMQKTAKVGLPVGKKHSQPLQQATSAPVPVTQVAVSTPVAAVNPVINAQDDDPFADYAPSFGAEANIVVSDANEAVIRVETQEEHLPSEHSAMAELEDQLLTPEVVMDVPVSLPIPNLLTGGKEPDELSLTFITWLKRGLSSGEISYNVSGARVQFVKEGLGLVSPGIFEQFRGLADLSDWRDVQKSLIDSDLVLKQPSGSKLFKYLVQVPNQPNPKAVSLTMIVLANPQLYVHPVPDANPYLSLLSNHLLG